MEKKWITASEIAKQANIPESTTRRYLNNFESFFKYQDRSRGRRYHPDAVVVVTRIQSLYSAGAESEEIVENLEKEFPITVNSHDPSTDIPPPVAPYATAEDLAKVIEGLEQQRKQQEEFNKALIDRLDERDRYIEESIRKRDENLMVVLREIQDSKKQIAAAEEEKEIKKPWWKFW